MIDAVDHTIIINRAGSSQVKGGTALYMPIVPANQHESTFYGLAKAAGADMKNSSNAVGTYTDEAKTAINKMIGSYSLNSGEAIPTNADLNTYTTPGTYSADSTVIASITNAPTTTDTYKLVVETVSETIIEQIVTAANGKVYRRTGNSSSTSWTFSSWIKDINSTDVASTSTVGVVKIGDGFSNPGDGTINVDFANADHIKAGSTQRKSITPYQQHRAVFYGLAKVAGVDMSSSSNAVGTYTDNAKSAIQNMLGISDGYVTKDSIDNAGITERTYTPVYGGEFTVTTATIDGYTHPTATIECETRPTFYSYRVSFTNNSTGETTEYIIPGRTWLENNGSLFSYLGNLQYFTAETDMVPGGTDTQCPFLIKERYSNSKYYLDISTETAGSYTFLVEKIAKTKTTISPELIYGIEQSPIAILRASEASRNVGVSIGENFIYSKVNTVAIGKSNVISSSNSTAIGHFNQVQASGAMAEGYAVVANGQYSHATGFGTTASGQYAHTEGYQTTASGAYSHAEGHQTTASGLISHSSGIITTASGYASNATGYNTTANSLGMYAIGQNNVADTVYPNWVSGTSYAVDDCITYSGIGFKCITANSDSTFTEEHWQVLNNNGGSSAFVVGNGGITRNSTPSNAYKVDWEGNGYYNGDVYVNCAADSTNGTKLVSETDYATTEKAGIVKVGNGMTITDNALGVSNASSNHIKAGVAAFAPIAPQRQHESVFYGLAKAAGDTTQSASSNAVGTYTEEAKTAIKSMLGVEKVITISGTAPTITAEENARYICGEVVSLNFTPSTNNICDVRFTSGSTVTTLTVPSTVKFPDWFDPTKLEANTVYEINVLDGIYGAVMTWAV